MNKRPRVGLIEDDITLCEALSSHVTKHDMDPCVFQHPDKMINAALSGLLDVLVIDLGLPAGGSGFDLIESLRRTSTIPILVVSGHTDLGSVTRALKNGADDYLRKPFHLEEFGLRVLSLIRRLDSAHSPPASKTIRLNEISIDTGAGTMSVAGPSVCLNERERVAMTALLENAPNPITKIELRHRLRLGEVNSSEALSTLMMHLRKKIARLGVRGNPIRSVRGVGYRLTALPATDAVAVENPDYANQRMRLPP